MTVEMSGKKIGKCVVLGLPQKGNKFSTQSYQIVLRFETLHNRRLIELAVTQKRKRRFRVYEDGALTTFSADVLAASAPKTSHTDVIIELDPMTVKVKQP